MDIQEILSEVGEEKAKIITDHYNALIDVEKKKGVDASKKKGAENTKLIAEVAKMKDTLKEVFGIDDLGEDLSETVKSAVSNLKTAKPDNATNGDAVKAIEERLNKQIREIKASMQKQVDDEKRKSEEVQSKYRNSKITSQLSDAMNGKIRGHDFVIKDLIREGKVRLDDSENVVFVGSDENDVFDTKKFLETFMKERSDLVISQQVPGGGSSGQRVDIKGMKQISHDQFQKLSLDKQKEFMTNGGKLLET